MQELWASASYQPHLLSLPLAFAPAAMLVVLAYAIVMRGEPVLRAWLLAHFASLMPYSVTVMLSPSIVSPHAAETAFRLAASSIPMAAAAGAGFQLHFLRRGRAGKVFVGATVAVAGAWLVICASTDHVIAGVRWLSPGLWYAVAGPWAAAALLSTVAIATPGFVLLALEAVRQPPSPARRQLRLVLAANLVTYAGLTDVLLAYGIGVFPLGWLLSGAGSVLVARALVVEDLLRVRAVDTLAPQLVLHLATALLLGAVVLNLLGHSPWWVATLVLAVSFSSVRAGFAVIGLISRGARGREDRLDRLVSQLVARMRPMDNEPAIARLASDMIDLGIGQRAEIWLASADDYGWLDTSGARIPDDVAPDPLVGAWLAEHDAVVDSDDLSAVPEDLRAAVEGLLARGRARAVIPITSGDELLAIVLLAAGARGSTRGSTRRELTFVERVGDRVGEAIVHVRMARSAAERATLAREVELAATVQQQLLPAPGRHTHGDFSIVGSWIPATRCAGDFWGVYPLGERRVLVAIGDVTGHGVASATVTAAAAAAVDVVVRRSGAALELGDLVAAVDSAVRRVGGGHLTMSFFASILDETAGQLSFVSCGHPTPYICRAGDKQQLELQVLVGRGNPLGSANVQTADAKVHTRPLKAGDLVVWYTDGVIEAKDASGAEFGDRRLQRLLKRLEVRQLGSATVHDLVTAAVAAHRGATLRDDDETLVVAHWTNLPTNSRGAT